MLNLHLVELGKRMCISLTNSWWMRATLVIWSVLAPVSALALQPIGENTETEILFPARENDPCRHDHHPPSNGPDVSAAPSPYLHFVSHCTPGAPPTPVNLTALKQSSQVALSWEIYADTASIHHYELERSLNNAVFSVIVANATGLAMTDTYSGPALYRVRSVDASGKKSAYSNIANTEGPQDGTPPSTPTGFGATAVSATQVRLQWNASTDSGGVPGYYIERCVGAGCTSFTVLTTVSQTTFIDTGCSPLTTYRYQIRARDTVGHLSSYAGPAQATTPADSDAPSVPIPSVASVGAVRVSLSWPPSTDNLAVTGYEVKQCQAASCINTSVLALAGPTVVFWSSQLVPSTLYTYQVRARDAAGNWSLYSTPLVNVTTIADSEVPTTPQGLSVSVSGPASVYLSWSSSTDDAGFPSYEMEECSGATPCTTFLPIGTVALPGYTRLGLQPGRTYWYRVRAADASGKKSLYSNVASGTTALDTVVPQISFLSAIAAPPNGITLNWSGSDNVGIVSYTLERCQGNPCNNFSPLITLSTAATSYTYTDTNGVLTSTFYQYRVKASDGSGHESSWSTVATANPTDTTRPTAPTTVTVTALSSTEIELTWSGATDNLPGLTYQVHWCLSPTGCYQTAMVGTSATTSFRHTARTPGVTYFYTIKTIDALGNASGASPIAGATTQAVSLPIYSLNLAGSSAAGPYLSRVALNLCDSSPVPEHYVNGLFSDARGEQYAISPGRLHVWVCTRGGTPVTLRFSTGYSSAGISALKQLESETTSKAEFLDHRVLTGCVEVDGNANAPGVQPITRSSDGREYREFTGCQGGLLSLPVNIGASDVSGYSFGQSNTIFTGGGTFVMNIAPIDDTNLPVTYIAAVPFSIVLGAGVQRVSNGLVQGKVASLTREEIQALLAGKITDWRQLSLGTAPPCTAVGVPHAGCSGPGLAPIGANADSTSLVSRCQARAGSGVKAALKQSVMLMSSEPSIVENLTSTTSGKSYIGISTQDVRDCVEGNAALNRPNHPNAIAYMEASQAATLTGGYVIRVDGYEARNTSLSDPRGNLKCGEYTFWAKERLYTRSPSSTDPVIAQLLSDYIAAASDPAVLSTDPIGQYWAALSEMNVDKNADRGPFIFKPLPQPASCSR